MTREEFSAAFGVSRETIDRLDRYETHLRKWNRAINLVSPRSLGEIWARHFVDSAQLVDLAPNVESWIDLGSGGGFPGLVVAILTAERNPDCQLTLIESDVRKCVFLREAARICGVGVSVLNMRIDAARAEAEIVSARALAPLAELLEMSEKLLLPGGRALFLKGETVEEELTKTRRFWHMELTEHPSRVDPRGTVLEITSFQRRSDG